MIKAQALLQQFVRNMSRCDYVLFSSTGRLWHLEKNISTRPMYCKIDVVLVALTAGCKFSSAKLGIFEGFVLKSIQTPV